MSKGVHTWQEIVSQPQVWQETLQAFAQNRADLEGFLERVSPSRLILTGCGSTHYLSQSGAALLSHCAAIPAAALPASELWLFGDAAPAERTLLVAVSRSGETTETIRALDSFHAAQGGPALTVTCYPQSTLAQQADFVLVAPDGQEQSVAQTRSFTSMLILLQALAAVLSRDEGMLERLHRLPALLEDVVARLGGLVQQLGADLELERFFFLGGNLLYGLANEAMLKTKEMSLSYSEAYHPLELRHGPMAMVNERSLVVGFLSDTGLAAEQRVLEDMRGLGARTLALVGDAAALSPRAADYVVELGGGLDDWERAPLYLPVVQRLAYHRAIAKGLDPDRPTNLTAVVEL